MTDPNRKLADERANLREYLQLRIEGIESFQGRLRFDLDVAEIQELVAALAPAPAADGREEPVAWIVLSKDEENVRIWWRRNDLAEEWSKTHNAPLIPLYAHPRCADAILSRPSTAAQASEAVIVDECQCEWPLIKCDVHGCRCTICGRPDRLPQMSKSNAPLPPSTALDARTVEACAQWHDRRARDTPDAFEAELHEVSAKAIRALATLPPSGGEK